MENSIFFTLERFAAETSKCNIKNYLRKLYSNIDLLKNDTDNDRRRRDLANDLNGDKFEQYDVEAKEVGNEALKEQDADFMTTDKFRWIVYQSIESILYRRNFDGKQCLLRAICEHAESPITPKCGLLGEIFHILLAPSSTVLNENMNDYMAAENFGLAGEPCGEIFKNCRYSLLEIFTQNKI